MTQVIDRRLNGKHKSAVNRQRFINRFKKQIKTAVSDAINKRSITDVTSGEKVIIPAKDVKEPHFQHGYGGEREIILPGNKEFITGDKLQRPQNGEGGDGSNASNSGEGYDDFTFELSREEFLELFFEDLELPHLIKTEIAATPVYKVVRMGFTPKGTPANINIIRSLKGALSRRIALSTPYRGKLKSLQEELDKLLATEDNHEAKILQEEIALLQRKIAAIPFIDTFDLRFNSHVKQIIPTTQAVMFCLMDVSGSMDKEKKDIAKRFFILLYLFLNHNYEKIDVVFIRHHTSAKLVDEQEFFYSRETGGTVVSSALELMKTIIMEQYPPSSWNIYAAQASDGDNWNADSPRCCELLVDNIMPYVQYYAYVEIMPRHHQSLWDAYLKVHEAYDNFAMQTLNSVTDIYPVFRELFKRHLV